MTTRTTALRRRGAGVLLTALVAALLTAGQAEATMPGEAGGRIAVTKKGDIWTTAPDGSDLRRLTTYGSGARNATWSPDGTRILFERGGYLWVMRADGSAKQRLFRGTGASWSPDGASVAYYTTPRGSEGSIVTRPLAGGQARVVDRYAASGWNDWQRSVGPDVSWTPDGTSLLYGASSPAWCDEVGCERAQTSVDESALKGGGGVPGRVLAKVGAAGARPSVDVSPDGRSYVFATNAGQADGESRLFLGDRATGRYRQLTRDVDTHRPAFDPTGTHVLYGLRRPDGRWEVRRVAVASPGAPVTVVKAASQPDVQPVH